MKTLYVAGTFDDGFGRPSRYASQLYAALAQCGAFGADWPNEETVVSNGGNYSDLANLVDRAPEFQIIYWFADMSNDYPKLLSQIKKSNPHALLISSKNNRGDYAPLHLMARALQSRSNLLLEFTREDSRSKWAATLWDPLGNIYTDHVTDITAVAQALAQRVEQLSAVQRIGSRQMGAAIAAPDQSDFFAAVRQQAERFHSLVHAVNQGRLLGNVSFRCEHGFPSFRVAGAKPLIFVSRRNLDKREIDAAGFVAVEADSLDEVRYYGDHKPSVDTPMQLRLYRDLPEVNFMLHGHTYIEGAPFTASVLPCGAVEESCEVHKAISSVVLSTGDGRYLVNLRGHGSLVMGNGLSAFDAVPYVAREFPEHQLAVKKETVAVGA